MHHRKVDAMIKYGYCPECSTKVGYRPQKINPWTQRVQKCKTCGAGLFEKGDVSENLAAVLVKEIEVLAADPESHKGVGIAGVIADGKSEEEAFAEFNVNKETGFRCLEKSLLLGVKSRKLKKLRMENES